MTAACHPRGGRLYHPPPRPSRAPPGATLERVPAAPRADGRARQPPGWRPRALARPPRGGAGPVRTFGAPPTFSRPPAWPDSRHHSSPAHLVLVEVVPHHAEAPRAQEVLLHQLLAGLDVAGRWEGVGRARWEAAHRQGAVARPGERARSQTARREAEPNANTQTHASSPHPPRPPHLRRPIPTSARSSPIAMKSPPSR
jgi:hypothetical protein